MQIKAKLFHLLALGTLLAFAAGGSSLSLGLGLPPTQDLKGEVVNDKGEPIKGAVCTLTSMQPGTLPQEGLTQSTGDSGGFTFPGLVPSTYDLLCAAMGHEPVEQKDIQVKDQPTPFMQIALPARVVIRQQVEVHEKLSQISQQSPAPPARLAAQQLRALPLTEQKFKAALPLVPGVVRTPDGRINIKGIAETQGMLLVDSADTVDPVTGSFSIDIPIDAIESLEVYKSAYNAQYGRFSGGLTSIATKPPSGKWHYELNDFIPTPRIKNGSIIGIADDRPRLTFTGPILPNRLNFSESFTYTMSKQPVRGLAYPHNEIKTEGFNSFTNFQYIFAANHLMTANVNIFPQRREFADINTLIPQSASSNYAQRGFTIGATDRFLLSSGGVLTTLFQFTKFDSYAHGQGPLDMLVTPNGFGGNYFNSWNRTSDQRQISEVYQSPRKTWRGKHDLKLGADVVQRSYDGLSVSRPVRILRADDSLAKRIDFSGLGVLAADDTEWAGFAQDHWIFNEHLALDAGLRYSGQTIGATTAFAPRAGLVYSPGTAGKTVFRGGAGIFYDRVPLLAGDFIHNPTRTVTLFDAQGLQLGAPKTFSNVYVKVDEKGEHIIPDARHLSSTPYNLTWNLEVDREVGPRASLRLSYLSSRTYDEFIIDPGAAASSNPIMPAAPVNNPILLLSNTGGLRYHEFEATVRVRASERSDISLSYVHSLAQGDLNTLTQVYVPFEQPVIRPNVYGDLPSKVPHRVVTWGEFRLPWKVTATPLLDVHTGFPYSNFDVLRNYAGVANSQHFPTFLSLDLKISKDFSLPFAPLLRNHTFRGSLQIFNITNHSNPLDVYSSTASPLFGHFVGFQHRLFDFQIDVLN